MIPLSQFPKEALDWAFDQVKDRGDWNSQTIRDLADQYLKTDPMKTDSETTIMGSVTFGPATEHMETFTEEQMKGLGMTKFATEWPGEFIPINLPQASPEPLDRWDVPLTFRGFLKAKKEVLEAYGEWAWAAFGTNGWTAHPDHPTMAYAKNGDPTTPWPESLQGLTREDIEVLKM